MRHINDEYTNRIESNLTPDELKALCDFVYRERFLTCPMRMSIVPKEDTNGNCNTAFDEEGDALYHEIEIGALNDSLFFHEAAHASIHEEYGYHELRTMNSHGSRFAYRLAEIIERYEESI